MIASCRSCIYACYQSSRWPCHKALHLFLAGFEARRPGGQIPARVRARGRCEPVGDGDLRLRCCIRLYLMFLSGCSFFQGLRLKHRCQSWAPCGCDWQISKSKPRTFRLAVPDNRVILALKHDAFRLARLLHCSTGTSKELGLVTPDQT